MFRVFTGQSPYRRHLRRLVMTAGRQTRYKIADKLRLRKRVAMHVTVWTAANRYILMGVPLIGDERPHSLTGSARHGFGLTQEIYAIA